LENAVTYLRSVVVDSNFKLDLPAWITITINYNYLKFLFLLAFRINLH
jgi:hypothetical protein